VTGLLRTELVRLLTRRAVLVLLAVAVVVPAVIAVSTVLNTRPPSAEDVAWAEQQIAGESESKRVQRQYAKCLESPERFGVSGDDVEQGCDEMVLPQLEWYLWYEPLSLHQQATSGAGIAVATVLAILMLIMGTTFVGHDWASGSVSNQLLFEPRRLRVWAAKAIVVGAVSLVLSALVLTVFWLALGWVVQERGDVGLYGGELIDCLQMGWRSAAVAAGAGIAGFALTMLFRSTVAALGVLLAVGLAGGVVLAVIGVDTIWNPGLNLLAVIADGATYGEDGPCPDGGGGGCWVERTLSLERGVAYLGVVLVAVVALSTASFRQRDVA
jgi:ABC-2 type transport system permease protein